MIAFIRDVWRLIRPYWKSPERWMARLLLATVVGLSLGEVYLNVLLNQWNNGFYDSLQNLNKPAFIHALIRFSYLATIFIIIVVYKIYLSQLLHLKWRNWLTGHYLNDWLENQNYYRIPAFGGSTDNPDQRISEDIDQFIRLTLDLSLGLLSSVVTLFSFLAILWQLSGALNFTLHGVSIHIPGYMVWVALVYAIGGTWITMKIGNPLIKLNFNQQRYEANFRFSLVRLRENNESVAFYKGEEQEKKYFLSRFSSVVENFWHIIRRQKTLNWFSSGYNQIATVFPFVVVAPRYFSGQIKLGGLMQTASAFGQVQGALSYIIAVYTNDPYTNVAVWKAVIDRLSGFNESVRKAEEVKPVESFMLDDASATGIHAKGLTIRLPGGAPLLEHLDLDIAPGDSLLITGRSGSGKSTLLRTLAGLWPFVEGSLAVPARAQMLFLPQKPYLPLGTLREALCYPGAPLADDAALRDVMALCQLEHLGDKLDNSEPWSHILSLGEQQRIAFARTFIAKPPFIFMDEATSALDEALEAHLYEALITHLPASAIISVGHRSTLKAWHKIQKNLG
jgi:putative ATP-binding cassette transporter